MKLATMRLGCVLGLGLAACFSGGSALGHPCESSSECGAGLVCDPAIGRCVEPSAADTTATAETTLGSQSDSQATNSTTLEPDTSADGPTTATESTGVTETSDTGACSDVGCACEGDDVCADGLICRGDQCTATVCGDRVVEGNEECEGGDEIDGDGCDADCTWTEFEMTPGYDMTCATIEGGRVRCWGGNAFGKLGRGDTVGVGDDEEPWEIDDIMMPFGVDLVAVGSDHACGTRAGTTDVLCWGSGVNGALGNLGTMNIGDDELLSQLPAVMVGFDVESTACGDAHCCALSTARAVRCWGHSNFGALGYGDLATIGNDETPASAGDVSFGGVAVEICAGYQTCARLDDGTLRCWGYNVDGELGNGNVESIGDNELPSSVDALDFGEAVTDIACGWGATCALVESGEVRCWGNGGDGTLGQAATASLGDDEPATAIPPIELGVSPAVAISAGRSHACALLGDQTVRCWGSNAFGELGLGHTQVIGDNDVPTDVDVVNIGEPVLGIRAGGYVTCVELEGNRVKCWGWGHVGQTGSGHTENLGDDEEPWELPDVQVFAP